MIKLAIILTLLGLACAGVALKLVLDYRRKQGLMVATLNAKLLEHYRLVSQLTAQTMRSAGQSYGALKTTSIPRPPRETLMGIVNFQPPEPQGLTKFIDSMNPPSDNEPSH